MSGGGERSCTRLRDLQSTVHEDQARAALCQCARDYLANLTFMSYSGKQDECV